MSTAGEKTQGVYISYFLTGLILIGAFFMYGTEAIKGPIHSALYAFICAAPIIGGGILALAEIGGFVIAGITLLHSILLIWVLILFFKDRPSNPNAIIIIDWVWAFLSGGCIILAIILFLISMLKGSSNRDDRYR